MVLKKTCPRCSKLIDYADKYCPVCTVIKEQERQQRYKDYKASRTDKREEAFYCSKAWEQVRELAKSKTNYIDIYQYYVSDVGQIHTGDVVHHILEIKDIGGWENRLNLNNLIYLTHESHAIVHAAYKKSKKDKEKMQKLLLQLVERFKNEFGWWGFKKF